MICSSAWSTLITSSMLREMSLPNRSRTAFMAISLPPSEDLRSVVVLGVKNAHEAKPGRTIQLPGIEENRGHLELPLELFEQRRRSVDRKEGSPPYDEYDVSLRRGVLRNPRCD